jgi:uncharacterized Tic20 family protein
MPPASSAAYRDGMDEAPSTDPGAARPADPSLAYEPPAHGSPSHPAGDPTAGDPTAGDPAWTSRPGTVAVTDQNWALAAHLSSLLTAASCLGFLGPLVVLLTAGNRSPFVRRHAVEALNFNLTVLIAAMVSVVLMLVLIGFLMILVVGVGYVIATIAGAVAASQGRDFRYPLTIRFVR